jgi:hypothetical protein
VVAGLKKVDGVVADAVHESLLSRDPSGPEFRAEVLQWLRLANAPEGVAPNLFHQPENLERDLTIRTAPVLEVLHAFVLDDCGAPPGTGRNCTAAFRGHEGSGRLAETELFLKPFQIDGRGLLTPRSDESRE